MVCACLSVVNRLILYKLAFIFCLVQVLSVSTAFCECDEHFANVMTLYQIYMLPTVCLLFHSALPRKTRNTPDITLVLDLVRGYHYH